MWIWLQPTWKNGVWVASEFFLSRFSPSIPANIWNIPVGIYQIQDPIFSSCRSVPTPRRRRMPRVSHVERSSCRQFSSHRFSAVSAVHPFLLFRFKPWFLFLIIAKAAGKGEVKKTTTLKAAKPAKAAADSKAKAPAASKGAGAAPAKKGGKASTPAALAKDKALKTKQAAKKGLITTRRRKIRTAIAFRLPKTLKTARKPKFPRMAVPHRPR